MSDKVIQYSKWSFLKVILLLTVVDLIIMFIFTVTHGEGIFLGSVHVPMRHTLSVYTFWLVILILAYSFLSGREHPFFKTIRTSKLLQSLGIYYLRSPKSLFVFVLCSAVFLYSMIVFFGEKLSDDYMILGWIKTLNISSLSDWKTIWHNSGFIRPLPILWWKLDEYLWNDNNIMVYFESVLLHVFNTFLFYVLLKKLSIESKSRLGTALLFFIFPIGAYAIGWLSVRYDLMATCFGFIFLISFLKWNENRRQLFAVFAMLALCGALLSKENAIVLPLLAIAIFPLTELYATQSIENRKSSYKKLLYSILPYLAIVLTYLVGRYTFFSDPGGYRIGGASIHTTFIPEDPSSMIIDLFQGIFSPLNLLFLNSLPFWIGLIELIGLVAFITLTAKAFLETVRNASSLILLILLPLLPIITHLGVEGDFKDARFLYMSSPFIALMIGKSLADTRQFIVVLISAVMLLGVNVAAHIDTYVLVNLLNRNVEQHLANVPASYNFRITNLPLSSNGIYVYGNGFPERFKLEKVEAGDTTNFEVLDVRELATGGEKRRNFSTLKLEGIYRKAE